MDEETEFHPVLDGLVFEDGETLRQRLERKQAEHGEMWTEVLKMAQTVEDE